MAAAGMRLGSLAPPTDAQEGLWGPQIVFYRGHSRQEGVYQEAHPAPRGREGRPQCNVSPEKHRPDACRPGKLDQTESGGGRGVDVKSAQ